MFHRGDGGHVREGSKCKHAQTAGAKIMSKRTAVGQFKGQFNGAMERYMWWFDLQERSPSARYNVHSNRQHFSGGYN